VGRYTLWCLNRAASWDLGALRDALRGMTHAARLGSRARFDAPPPGLEPTRDGVLMYEDPRRDEYFVPIVVKCLGDPNGFARRLGAAMSPEGRRHFDRLLDDYRYFYRVSHPLAVRHWRDYWGTFSLGAAYWNVGMLTRTGADDYLGYYEIVRREALENGEKAVLVGYSQGGLVARFLAWMDEQLMLPEERVIAGVITVQSPNHGSPLAGRGNQRLVSVGLIGMLTGLGGISIVGDNPKTRAAIEALSDGFLRLPPSPAPFRFGVSAVCAVLDQAIADSVERGDTTSRQTSLLRTARKWLTGLSRDKVRTAFFDVDPSGLDSRRTILGRLVESPHQDVFHGAVIGANSSLEDLILQTRPWWQRWAVRRFVAPQRFSNIESAYTRIAVDEDARHHPPTGARRRRLAGLYVAGVPGNAADPELPAYAHDFVVPSVSQALCLLTPPPPGNRFLGNVVNPSATHISGAYPGGAPSDVPHVRRMLRTLSDRLA
jgi:hypothetical protein